MRNGLKTLYQCIGKDGTYELLGHSTGAGTDRGHDVEVYREIHTGRLFHRLPDDFENRMEFVGKLLEFPRGDAAELQQWRELFDAVIGDKAPLWPNPWEGEVAILAYFLKNQRENLERLMGVPAKDSHA